MEREILAEIQQLRAEIQEMKTLFAAPPQQLYTAQQAQRILGISAATFYEWIRQGNLPPGRQYGPRSRRWSREDLQINGRLGYSA
ncbi:MAG: helix-turn-helix transcriptional regulator [Aminivibrio sp.]|jgi:excisionase family DNA binding protein